MTVQRTQDRSAWDAFLERAQPPTFLQSWAWGETQRALGETVVRLVATDTGETLGIAQAVTVTARRGKFLHVPHGPVMSYQHSAHSSQLALAALVGVLRAETRRLGCAFLRVSPVQVDTPEHRGWYRDLGFRAAPIHLHAERLWILDLAPSEEALLAGMRKTTRNLVRRADREGVTVGLSDTGEGSDSFLRLYEETARREGFTPFSRNAIAAEVHAFTVLRKTVNSQQAGERTGILVGVAEALGEPLAAAVVPLIPWSAFYHHGASSRLHPHIPAAYALQWALIREAKRRGCATYNFWGITPTLNSHRSTLDSRLPTLDSRSHPWAGLTLFKTGFGGREVPLVPTQDLPLSARYWFTFTVDTLRRLRRGT